MKDDGQRATLRGMSGDEQHDRMMAAIMGVPVAEVQAGAIRHTHLVHVARLRDIPPLVTSFNLLAKEGERLRVVLGGAGAALDRLSRAMFPGTHRYRRRYLRRGRAMAR